LRPGGGAYVPPAKRNIGLPPYINIDIKFFNDDLLRRVLEILPELKQFEHENNIKHNLAILNSIFNNGNDLKILIRPLSSPDLINPRRHNREDSYDIQLIRCFDHPPGFFAMDVHVTRIRADLYQESYGFYDQNPYRSHDLTMGSVYFQFGCGGREHRLVGAIGINSDGRNKNVILHGTTIWNEQNYQYRNIIGNIMNALVKHGQYYYDYNPIRHYEEFGEAIDNRPSSMFDRGYFCLLNPDNYRILSLIEGLRDDKKILKNIEVLKAVCDECQ
jgi:hypothetical protein